MGRKHQGEREKQCITECVCLRGVEVYVMCASKQLKTFCLLSNLVFASDCYCVFLIGMVPLK